MRISPYTGAIKLERGDEVVVERMARLAGVLERMFPGDVGEAASRVTKAIVTLVGAIEQDELEKTGGGPDEAAGPEAETAVKEDTETTVETRPANGRKTRKANGNSVRRPRRTRRSPEVE